MWCKKGEPQMTAQSQDPKPHFAEGQEVYQEWIGELFKVKIIKYLPNSNRCRTQKIKDDSVLYSIPALADVYRLYLTKTAFYQAKLEKENKDIAEAIKRKDRYEAKIKELGGV